MSTKMGVSSEVQVNGQRLRMRVPNQLLQAAFNLVGSLLTGATTTNRFSSIALIDGTGDVIITKAATFTFSTKAPLGIEITGSAVFVSSEVTRDVHLLQLRDATGAPLAEALLPTPLDAGESVVITRTDTFTQAAP